MIVVYSKEELFEIFNDLYCKKGKYITVEEVQNKLGISNYVLRKNMLNVDGYSDCPDVFLHIKKSLRNFDNITPESAYWIGYLLADGCLTNQKSKDNYMRLMLECKVDDKEILECFCDFLGIRRERITSGHNGKSVALSLSARHFTTDLQKFGIVHNKSHTETRLPDEVKDNEVLFFQCLRGLIDGDGTIHTYSHSPGISLVSNSKSLLEDIKIELNKYIPEPSSIWITTRARESMTDRNVSQDIHSIKIGTGRKNRSNINYIYHQFYDGHKIILSRKEQLFRSLI